MTDSVRDWLLATRRAQGLPDGIEDASTLTRLALTLNAVAERDEGPRRAPRSKHTNSPAPQPHPPTTGRKRGAIAS